MNIAVIKKLVDKYSIEELKQAEQALLEEQHPKIDLEGEDEGEQLTHALAAIWIKEEMEKENIPMNKAIRNYSQKVRKSIG